MKYDYLYNYLNKSIQNIIDELVKPYDELLFDYEYLRDKTKLLFTKIIDSNKSPKNMISYKVCIAACFWIVHKYHDDDVFYSDNIIKCFRLDNIAEEYLLYWEIRILRVIDWDLCFILNEKKIIPPVILFPQ